MSLKSYIQKGFCALGLALMLLGTSACASFTAVAPAGFAPFEKQGGELRAVSPDGVVYRVRDEKHKPHADLAFWKEALKKRMIDAGYHFVAEQDVSAGGKPGYLLELSAPVGEQDYGYWVAVFDAGSQLVLVEAAGEVTKLAARRDQLLAAIKATQF
jgi:hypothetical protein